MTSKSDKGKKSTRNTNSASGKETAKKASMKEETEPEVNDEDDEVNDEEVDDLPVTKKGKTVTSAKKTKAVDDDEEEEEVEEKPDDWEKPEEEEEWDPDFEEFDVPKSKGKKAVGGTKKASEEEDEFKIDDEFKDMFNDDGLRGRRRRLLIAITASLVKFTIADFQLTKDKLLNWVNQFPTFCFLDNHQYQLNHTAWSACSVQA